MTWRSSTCEKISRYSTAVSTGAPTVWKETFQKRRISLYSRVRKPAKRTDSGAMHHPHEDLFEVRFAEHHLFDLPAGQPNAREHVLDLAIGLEGNLHPAVSGIAGSGQEVEADRRAEAHPQGVRSKALEQVVGGVERHHPPRLEHGDAVAQGLRFFEVMRGQHDGVAVGIEPADELPQPLAQLHIHARGGLVEHDHRRAMHQRLRHQHPPLHAAREHAHVGVGLVGEVEAGEDLVDPGVVAADAEITRLQAQRFAHGEEGVEHQFLRHHAKLAPRLAVVGHHVVTHHRQRALVDPRQTGQCGDQRGLAGAIGAEQAEEFALADRQIHPVERLERAITLAHPGNANRRVAHAPGAASSRGNRSVTP